MPSSLPRRSSSRYRSLSLRSTPSSRSSSGGSSRSRTSKLDLYSKVALSTSLERLQSAPGSSHSLAGSSFQISKVKRWDGTRRTTTNWDNLRRVNRIYPNSRGELTETTSRTPNYGFPVVTAWFTSTAKDNLSEDRLYVCLLRMSKPVIADLCWSNLAPSQYPSPLPRQLLLVLKTGVTSPILPPTESTSFTFLHRHI